MYQIELNWFGLLGEEETLSLCPVLKQTHWNPIDSLLFADPWPLSYLRTKWDAYKALKYIWCLNGKLVRFEHRDPMDHISNNSHCVCLDRISLVALISSDHQEELWYCIYSGRVGDSSEKPPPIILLFCLRFMAYTGQTCGTAQSPHKLCEKIVHHLRCNTSLETLNINRTSR